MSDFGGEVMAEVLAEQALVRPQIIPLVPLTNQYRHQDHIDHKDYKSKVRHVFLLSSLTQARFRREMYNLCVPTCCQFEVFKFVFLSSSA